MDIAALRKIGLSAILIGGLLIAVGQLLPLVKTPQAATWSGPQAEITEERSYSIDYYVIPPIDRDTPISVEMVLTKSGTIAILAFPTSQSGDPVGPPVLREILESGNTSLRRTVLAGETAHYMFVVTSWGSRYVLTVKSVWSPFYELKPLTLYGFIIALGGAFTYYYSRVKAGMLRVFQSVSQRDSFSQGSRQSSGEKRP